jgi:GDP-L-fucose synthase
MIIKPSDTILVTGATGFFGRHLMPVLTKRYPQAKLVGLGSRDGDLMDPTVVRQLLDTRKPTVVVHLAAYSGGIEANRTYSADFFHRNLILMENMFHACALAKIPKLVYPMGGCSYPNSATSPIDESQMWNGYPVETSAGYSVAKKMGIVAASVHQRQYGLQSIVLIPGNMYGEFDNYEEKNSHVIPGLIRRFFEAKRDKRPTITLWGTGRPQRDFVYAGDVAEALPYFIDHDEEHGPINISSGTSTSIIELSTLIARLTNYPGKILWDTAKPDGQMVKIFDVRKLHALGLVCNTPLEVGLRRTIEWFAANYDKRGVVRL